MQIDRRQLMLAGAAMATIPAPANARAGTDLPAPPLAPGVIDRLAAEIERCRQLFGVPGLSVAIVRNGKPIYLAGHGVRQHGAKAKVDADTLFQIGSTSKAFCAAAAGLLVDQGKIAWNDPVKKHLPGFTMPDRWLTENLTIKDALTHRTGYVGFWSSATAVIDLEECLSRIKFETPVGRFRDSFVYNNVMYGVVQAVIEHVSGQGWFDFVARHIFEPLGMTRTRPTPLAYWPAEYVTGTFLGTVDVRDLHYRHALDANVAMPHIYRGDGSIGVLPWQSYDNLAAAGSIVSSARDMAHWLAMHLAQGRYNEREILKSDTIGDMHKRQNFALPDPPGFDRGQSGYGMGWLTRSYRGRRLVEHTGGIEGFPAYVGFLPDDDIGMVILAAGFTSYMRTLLPAVDSAGRQRDLGGMRKAISLLIYDILLGNPRSVDWAETLHAEDERDRAARLAYFAQVPAAMNDISGPQRSLSSFAGRYKDQTGRETNIEIVERQGTLELRFPGKGAYVARLRRRGNAIFFIDPVTTFHTADFLRFDLDEQGRATGFNAFMTRFVPA